MLNHRIKILFIFAALSLLTGCSDQLSLEKPNDNSDIGSLTTQQFLPSRPNAPLISPQLQQQRVSQYVSKYFSPWTYQQAYLSRQAILAAEQDFIRDFMAHPGYGENYQPLATNDFEKLQANMDLLHFPNHDMPAILVNNTALRTLPTLRPSFHNPMLAGEGYPFDYLQESYVDADTPVRILQQTKDGQFSLILLGNDVGWVLTNTLAQVDQAFVRQWRRGPWVVISQSQAPLFVSQQFYAMGRLGLILPLAQKTSQGFKVYIAVANSRRHAVLKTVLLTQAQAQLFPLPLTAANLSREADQLLGRPYNWGGIHGDYDCSLTLMAIFRPFGVWMPRSSRDQLKLGQTIDLSSLDRIAKTQMILHHAKPWLTIIGMPGHVMLYIGQRDQQPYVYNTVWGLHTQAAYGQEGRLIIGKVTVMPLNYRHQQQQVSKDMLDRVTTMTRLTSE